MNTGRNVKELVLSPADALAAVRHYLEDLRDTGVDALPRTGAVPASRPASPEPMPVVQEAAAINQETALSTTDQSDPSVPEPSAALPVQQAAEVQVEAMDAILADLQNCGRCDLGKTRTNLVFGVGNPKARLVFVGEAPGRDEDLQGIPFVGEAGQLLTKIIEAMGFARDEVYICNVLKCRPPNNRNPEPAEIDACSPFMLRQVKATGAEAIVALGTFASQTLLRTKEPISRLRGKFHDYHGIPLMPTFHPAYLLRNAAMKREVWEDMQKVMKLLGKEVTRPKGKETSK